MDTIEQIKYFLIESNIDDEEANFIIENLGSCSIESLNGCLDQCPTISQQQKDEILRIYSNRSSESFNQHENGITSEQRPKSYEEFFREVGIHDNEVCELLKSYVIDKNILKIFSLDIKEKQKHAVISQYLTSGDEMKDNKKLTLPLVTVHSEYQEGVAVERNKINENTIKLLCNESINENAFYKDPLAGNVIHFDSLNHLKFSICALLGPIKNVFQYLKINEFLDDVDLLSCYSSFVTNGEGIYLITNLLSDADEDKFGFLCIYSKQDLYFSDVHSRSNAIHFVRYMTQMTTDIKLFPNIEDLAILSVDDQNVKRVKRHSSYNLKQHQLHTESCDVHDFGEMNASNDVQNFAIHASNTNSLIISEKLKVSSKNVFKKGSFHCTIKEFFEKDNYFAFENIHKVDDLFKEEYIKLSNPELHKKISENLKAYEFEYNKSTDLNDLMWNDLRFVVYNCLRNQCKYHSELLIACRRLTRNDYYKNFDLTSVKQVQKFLNNIFENKLIEQYNGNFAIELGMAAFDDNGLLNERNEQIILGNDLSELKSTKTGQQQNLTFHKLIMSFVSDRRNISYVDDALSKLHGFLDSLIAKVLFENNSQPSIQSLRTKHLQQQMKIERRRALNEEFDMIVNKNGIDDDNDIIIMSVEKADMNYKVFTKQCDKSSAKLNLKISKIAQIQNPMNGQPFSNDTHNLLDIGSYKIDANEEICYLSPCHDFFILLVTNICEHSKLRIINLRKSNVVLEIPFAKRTSLVDFDNYARIVAIYSYHKNNSVKLYKFSEDFTSFHGISDMDIGKTYDIDQLDCIALQYRSKFLWMLGNDNRLLRVDIKTCSISIDSKFKPPEKTYKCIRVHPTGECIFLFSTDGLCYPIMTASWNTLQIIDYTPEDVLYNFGTFSIIATACNIEKNIKFKKLCTTTEQLELQIQKERDRLNQETEEKTHWLYYFYWMFTKFPCDDILNRNQKELNMSVLFAENTSECQNCDSILQKYMLRIRKKLQLTNKPLEFLGIHSHQKAGLFSDPLFKNFDFTYLGDFVKQIICLVPIQIARCQFNEFYVLNSGNQLITSEAHDVFDLKNKISLGLLETIFNSWNGEIKAISSMGKQSTGKSYTLNHLTGTSFDISGGRCTDGCWIALKYTEDCLFVIMDFEGLGSFERTDQDDMLLSLFNSAVSNMTLFKTEYHLDRDVEQMFSKFNQGSNQLKDTSCIFQGRFFIIIKDVAEQDIDEVQKEFEKKILAMISKEKENNFISKLYKSDFDIIPFSGFQLEDYYEDMEYLLSTMIDNIKCTFFDGFEFMDFIKLLLAKFAISDFTSLDRQQIDSRFKYLKSYMKNALLYGKVCSDATTSKEFDLHVLDDINKEIRGTKNIVLQNFEKEIKLIDSDFVFHEDSTWDIISSFSSIFQQTADNTNQWRTALEEYLQEALSFRFERVEQWINENTRKWKSQNNAEYEDANAMLMDHFCLMKHECLRSFRFCNNKCSSCFVKCIKIEGHSDDHTCSTNHTCDAPCAFCEPFESINCKYSFGHEGKHICKEVNHMCGMDCSYFNKNECVNECQLQPSHDGEHLCGLKVHFCNSICSLSECDSGCHIDCDFSHMIHKCSKEQCTKKCSIANCQNICTVLDHFHGEDISIDYRFEQNIDESCAFSEYHCCGNEHQCKEECSVAGFCKVTVEKSIDDMQFIGARDTFTYTRHFVQKGEKLNCLKRILPFELTHEGEHMCSKDINKFHSCDETCPTCENICDKPFGHPELGDNLHNTSHGNMTKCSFIANADDFEIGTHKYKVGEPAVAEMCHMFCNSLGRGHIHVVECDTPEIGCIYSAQNDLRQHQTCKYGPDVDVEKDEIQHSKYWETIGWQDPCTESDIGTFGKCPYFCSHESHESQKSFCIGDLWHEKFDESMYNFTLINTSLSKEGHAFSCIHSSSKFHFILALDDSGSMRGEPWQALTRSVEAFVNSRVSMGSKDKLTIVMHSNTTLVTAEYIEIERFQSHMLRFRGHGNDFTVALNDIDCIISKYISKSITPVLIFMSDGMCRNGETEMRKICEKFKIDYNFECFTIGFGSRSFRNLEKLAMLGGGEFKKCPTDISLQHAFVDIAAKHASTVSVISSK